MDLDLSGYDDLSDPDASSGAFGQGASPSGSPNWLTGFGRLFAGQPGGYGAGGGANAIGSSAGFPSGGLFGQLSDILPQGSDPSWGLLTAPTGWADTSPPAAPDYGGLFSQTAGALGSVPSGNGSSSPNRPSMSAPADDTGPADDATPTPAWPPASNLDPWPDTVSAPQAANSDPLSNIPFVAAPDIAAPSVARGRPTAHYAARSSGRALISPTGPPAGPPLRGAIGGMPSPANAPAMRAPSPQGQTTPALDRIAAYGQQARNLIDAAESKLKSWVEPPVRFIGGVAANPDTYRGIGEVLGGFGLGGAGATGLGASLGAEGGSGGLATPLAVPAAAFSTGTILTGSGLVTDGGKTLGAVFSKAADDAGSYTNLHKSEKTYDGKGPESRAKRSASRVKNEFNDDLVKTDWTPSGSQREAFKDEARRMGKNGGPKSANSYNKMHSPGRRYLKEDGEDP